MSIGDGICKLLIKSNDSMWCDPQCPFLKPTSDNEYELGAICIYTKEHLDWYDYWIAVCLYHRQ